MERKEIIDFIYSKFDEEKRLVDSRQGQLEYLTTMHYIHEMIPVGSKILEIGAGTGRYSQALARDGYTVFAGELAQRNLEVLRKKAEETENMTALYADATDLSCFEDNSFDAVLSFGPMYHLYDKSDIESAINESIRITKPGGIIMTAFISIYAVMFTNYLRDNFSVGLKENFDSNYKVLHFKEQGFTAYDINDFERLFDNKPIRKLKLAGTDSVFEIAEKAPDFKLSDEDFARFFEYHLATCEKRELLGSQSHLLYIIQKNT